jgi:hypothetical protein
MLAQDGSHFRSVAKRATLHRADEENAFGQVTLDLAGFTDMGAAGSRAITIASEQDAKALLDELSP